MLQRNYCVVLLVIVLLCVQCGKSSIDIEPFIVANKSALPSLDNVMLLDLTPFGIKTTDRWGFKKKYAAYLSEYDKVLPNYKDCDAVRVFTALRLNDYRYAPTSNVADAVNPTYMAFALLTGAGIDFDHIGSREHIRLLAQSYGVTDLQVENGIWQTLTHGPNWILNEIVALIDHNLMSLQQANKAGFISGVIFPYLTLLSRTYTVPDELENRIVYSFGIFFPDTGKSAALFKDYIDGFKNYAEGLPCKGYNTNKINMLLKSYHFYLNMNIDVCRMDSLLDYTIPIDTFGVRNIVMHKRAGISLIGNAMGWATYEDSDIVVASENLAEQVRKIEIAVSTDSIVQVYSVGANYFWRTIGLSLTSDSANRLCRNLLRKEFGKCGKAAITDKLLRDVVTHELKHKYDEKMLLGTRRIAMDAEISAHLTEAIYGQSPLYALFLYTQRLQYFYVNVQQPEVHTALKPLIIEAWNLAIKVSNNTATTQDVVTTLKKRYAVYVTLTGSAFPSLGLFDNAIIKKKLQKIPEYRM